MVKKSKGNTYDADPTPPSVGYHGASFESTTSMVIYQRSSEVAPLLPGKVKRRGTSAACSLQIERWILALLALLFFALATYHICVHVMLCPKDPSTRDAIRRGWEAEEAQHTAIQRDWHRKAQEQHETERRWLRDTKEHDREVARRIHEERVRQEKFQQEWTREVERHEREFEEMRRREREEWERERERWKREVEERERREEEERQKLHMYWGRVDAHTCTTYATREYTAQLMNLPATWARRSDACKATPLEIHGISYLPTSCEDRGPGVVIGRWEINQREPDCTTFWNSYNDKGCTSPGSGKKYITHKLMNLPEKSDWREFCATTPAYFDHLQFPGAQECFTTLFGVYGQWEMDDSNC